MKCADEVLEGVEGQMGKSGFTLVFSVNFSVRRIAKRLDHHRVSQMYLQKPKKQLTGNAGQPDYLIADRFALALESAYAHLKGKGYATVFELISAVEALSDTVTFIDPVFCPARGRRRIGWFRISCRV